VLREPANGCVNTLRCSTCRIGPFAVQTYHPASPIRHRFRIRSHSLHQGFLATFIFQNIVKYLHCQPAVLVEPTQHDAFERAPSTPEFEMGSEAAPPDPPVASPPLLSSVRFLKARDLASDCLASRLLPLTIVPRDGNGSFAEALYQLCKDAIPEDSKTPASIEDFLSNVAARGLLSTSVLKHIQQKAQQFDNAVGIPWLSDYMIQRLPIGAYMIIAIYSLARQCEEEAYRSCPNPTPVPSDELGDGCEVLDLLLKGRTFVEAWNRCETTREMEECSQALGADEYSAFAQEFHEYPVYSSEILRIRPEGAPLPDMEHDRDWKDKLRTQLVVDFSERRGGFTTHCEFSLAALQETYLTDIYHRQPVALPALADIQRLRSQPPFASRRGIEIARLLTSDAGVWKLCNMQPRHRSHLFSSGKVLATNASHESKALLARRASIRQPKAHNIGVL
jgi:hypothetical protein